MAQDYGILITSPGVAVGNAKPGQVVMNTSNPFIKIDTQKPNSFASILLLITTDPPEPPAGGGNTYTTVYKFKHDYTYIPAIETLFFVTANPPGSTGTQTYFLDNGRIGTHGIDDAVFLYATADATYVYYIINKYNDGSGSANLLTGTNIQITTHVFAEDVGA